MVVQAENLFEIHIEFLHDSFRTYKLESTIENKISKEICQGLVENPISTLYELGFLTMVDNLSESMSYLWKIANKFIYELSRDSDLNISKKPKAMSEETLLFLLDSMPYIIGIEHVNEQWFNNIWAQLSSIFIKEIGDSTLNVVDYLLKKKNDLGVVGRVYFHLVENKFDEDYQFAFLATYSSGTIEKVNHVPLKNALIEYKEDTLKLLELLQTITKISETSQFIKQMLDHGELFSPIRLTNLEAYTFLKEIELYESCGVVCRIPNWWRRKNNAKISISIKDKDKTSAGLKSLLEFEVKIDINGVEVTREELLELLKQNNGLRFIKGRWIEINHEKLQLLLNDINKLKNKKNLSISELVRLQMGIGSEHDNKEEHSLQISNMDWLQQLQLQNNVARKINLGQSFNGTLRSYQQVGSDWLATMQNIGLGALLADDMGLGKTIQVLAFLEFLRETKEHKTLLIVPASLLFNWEREASKFTPKMRVAIIHNKNRDFKLPDYDLFITTYSMASRIELINQTNWDLIILDEAQAIRNAQTKQSINIKKLQANYRIALTGTPIENRLLDLWSIFDFLNKGMLGTLKEFSEYSNQLKKNNEGYAKLKSIVSPLIMRRVKTDKTIIKDLPDKVENKVYVGLSKVQIALYEELINELADKIENIDGIARSGIVLTTLMKCKQICNHPDQYIGKEEYNPLTSGKFEALKEICEVIKEKRERVLIFTQFKEIIEPLQKYLSTIFGVSGLILHGGTSIKQRGKIVEKFNGDKYIPFMILSLKAGGVGLNLTSANHVIHFDRWWNPAVENQATDRAFRIGQQKNVIVHKFITSGSIEEKIDDIISEKQQVADDIVQSSGENWITNMKNNDIMKLFRFESKNGGH